MQMKVSVHLFIIFLIAGVSNSTGAFGTSFSILDWGALRDLGINLEAGMIENIALDTQFIQLGVLVGQMKYDKSILEVKHGSNVSIVFKNNGIMAHNILVLRPGSKNIVGMAADQMISQNDAKDKDYIPDLDEVLFHTPLVDPGKEFKLVFKVPEQKGDYPFLCTFPGHWRIMQGILKVK